ncbi:unnamed protein product [Gordionus sp. m RMFG-2023]|uniref:calcipressin-1-like n=1 Tax=Gordionus sp. m RMFG-2023 TaxID=3053472 RepID=UPI0030DF4D2C
MDSSDENDIMVKNMLEQIDDNFDYTGLPSNIIITNVSNNVFTDHNVKAKFEKLFEEGSHVKNVIYLPSFKRVRVDFDSPKSATYFRIVLNEIRFEENIMKAFFIQDPLQISTETHLKIPPPFRNFLISPPCSPPEGWEQAPEARPVLNYDLISALAQLTPGESHELHPETHKTPKIIVHIAKDENDEDDEEESSEDPDSSIAQDNEIPKKSKKKKDKKFSIKALPSTAIHTPRPPLKTQ